MAACRLAADSWPYSKWLTSAEGLAGRKQRTKDPTLSSVAFRPSVSLDWEKGIARDTDEPGLPMARW